jgi:TRAP-type C4-dicarboxylate transport system substrate-binding protein
VRRILFSLGLLAAAMACAYPAGAHELRISHQFPDMSDARGRAVRFFAAEVTLRAPEIKFSIHPQLSLGLSRDEQLTALQSGRLDMAVLPLVFAVPKIPEFSLALLPGLIPNLDAIRAIKGSPVHAQLQEVAEAHGLHIVTWWWMRGGFATTGQEITGPASVAGRTILSCGLVQDLLQAAGAQASDMAWNDMRLGLEMGAIDAVLVPYEDFLSMRLHEQAKFGTFGGLSIFTCFSPLLMSKKTWDRLTPAQRQAVEEAAEESDRYFEASQRNAEARALELFTKAGAKVRAPSAHDYLSWLELAQRTAWKKYERSSPASRELLVGTVRVLLDTLRTKEEIAEDMYGAEDKPIEPSAAGLATPPTTH